MTAVDTLWAELTANSAVPAAPGAFTRAPSDPRLGYVLLGARAVSTAKGAGGRWTVQEVDVRRAAEELRAGGANMDGLVCVAPFRSSTSAGNSDVSTLRWRQRLGQEWDRVRATAGREQHSAYDGDHLPHLAGIDWRRTLVVRPGAGPVHTWWLPRALVRVLDAAEHAEAQWLQAARTCHVCGAVAEQAEQWRVQTSTGWQTRCPDCRVTARRPYRGELDDHVYAVLSRKRSLQVSEWQCAVCQEAPASVIDHCHEHGYVRAPVCASCNTRERPNYVYSNDVYVTNRYASLFQLRAEAWLTHWHRCSGCRARTTLPLAHLAALTALLAGEPRRSTHRDPTSSRRRRPCGELRASWKGSAAAPGSCVITVGVDFCPSGEHRVLAQVSYRDAVNMFRDWLTETAPGLAAVAGPGRHDRVPRQFRPVIAETSGEGPALF
ncbi:endonuclease domain-containing protein [Streptacidiphilus melanogenes]|uniref:endonuclease domain-containing protein n=1 Tax=Streptacidiphilus melanogenes TaxID=411235 RepID=UPI001F1F871E|nr:endonuclease domain-containing protein [Streptacidiphilus melanogenes]